MLTYDEFLWKMTKEQGVHRWPWFWGGKLKYSGQSTLRVWSIRNFETRTEFPTMEDAYEDYKEHYWSSGNGRFRERAMSNSNEPIVDRL